MAAGAVDLIRHPSLSPALPGILSTAAESTPLEQLEQLEPIEPDDLSIGALKSFFNSLLPGIRSLAFNLVVCFVILLVGRRLIRFICSMLRKALERAQADTGLVRFLGSMVEIVLHVILIFMMLGQLGVNTASIVTVLGTLMLAVGMSLQGSLANVAGGILLLLMHPFRVGHYIICEYGEGTVSMIGPVYTTITTKDNRVLTVPNSLISNCAVTNCGENERRRLDIIVGIGYESDLGRAKEILLKICEDNPLILEEPAPVVFVDNLADSSVDIGLYCYVPSSSFLDVKWQVTEQIKLRFDQDGISIPYPQMQVHMT